MVASEAATVAPYTMKCFAAAEELASAEGCTAMRYVAAVAAWLVIAIEETTVDVEDGTVYRVPSVVAPRVAVATWPKILYAVGIKTPWVVVLYYLWFNCGCKG